MRIPSWFVALLMLTWALVVVWSLFATVAVDGPGNMETGLRKLDILVRWQLIAAGLALFSALCGFLVRPLSWRMRFVGLLPVVLTGVAAIGLVGFVMFAGPANDVPQGAGDPKNMTEPVN